MMFFRCRWQCCRRNGPGQWQQHAGWGGVEPHRGREQCAPACGHAGLPHDPCGAVAGPAGARRGTLLAPLPLMLHHRRRMTLPPAVALLVRMLPCPLRLLAASCSHRGNLPPSHCNSNSLIPPWHNYSSVTCIWLHNDASQPQLKNTAD